VKSPLIRTAVRDYFLDKWARAKKTLDQISIRPAISTDFMRMPTPAIISPPVTQPFAKLSTVTSFFVKNCADLFYFKVKKMSSSVPEDYPY